MVFRIKQNKTKTKTLFGVAGKNFSMFLNKLDYWQDSGKKLLYGSGCYFWFWKTGFVDGGGFLCLCLYGVCLPLPLAGGLPGDFFAFPLSSSRGGFTNSRPVWGFGVLIANLHVRYWHFLILVLPAPVVPEGSINFHPAWGIC